MSELSNPPGPAMSEPQYVVAMREKLARLEEAIGTIRASLSLLDNALAEGQEPPKDGFHRPPRPWKAEGQHPSYGLPPSYEGQP